MAVPARYTGGLVRAWHPQPPIRVYPALSNAPGSIMTYNSLMQMYRQSMSRPMGVPKVSGLYAGRSGTLRQRMMGGIPGFLEDHLEEVVKLIVRDSSHQHVDVGHGWHHQRDLYQTRAKCRNCEKQWTARVTAMKMQTWGTAMMVDDDAKVWQRDLIRELMTPLIEGAVACECFGVREEAMMAEWLTTRLAAAGSKGMPYVQVVHEAVEARMCAPKDVDVVLRKMDFVPEWVTLEHSGVILPGGWDGAWTLPILYLPHSHPLRDW